MAKESPFYLVSARDRDVFQALNRSPLTVRQLLKLSDSFAYRFTTERRVQERLQCLCAAGWVRRWPYATASRGALSYYTLTPLGFRLLHGHEAMPAGRGLFGPVGVARQAHTQALAEVVVHFLLGAHRSGVPVESFHRENAMRLQVGDACLYPDASFALRPDPDSRFTYFVEVDNRTETVWPGTALDSWGRKVQFYEQYQDIQEERFRVLAITTGGPARLNNMLQCAAALTRNPRRSLVYGITLRDFLETESPLGTPCFRNPQGESVALLSPVAPTLQAITLTVPPPMVFSTTCLRPHSRA